MLELYKNLDVSKVAEPKLTVVFLHGIAADSTSFNDLVKHLSKNDAMREVRFITLDLLGAGKSYTSDELKYNFKEQIEALYNSLVKLKSKAPIIIVAHSMGTMIAARFANQHKKLISGLVLISTPIYREEDLKNPLFATAMDGFREVIKRKNRELLTTKAFNNEIKNIVSNAGNYKQFTKITQPTILIYGELDGIIMSTNIPGLLKNNPNIVAIKTPGAHGVTIDKYSKILKALKEFLEKEAK